MQITSKTLPASRLEYIVDLTAVETAEFFERAVMRLAATIKIAGFRPGKAPAKMVREQIEPEKLREEAYSLAVADAWHKVIHQLKQNPIEDPAVEVQVFEEGKAAKLQFTFDVRPEVKIKDWQAIKLTALKKKAISDQEVDDVLAALSKGHAETIIQLTPAKLGDKIEVTFDGYLKNVKQEKLSSKHFPIILGEKTVIPGFAEQMIGLKKNDKKTFDLTFPADHFDKELANQKVRFEATIDDVYEVKLPKLTDDFGKKFGHDNLAQLKKAIKADLDRERSEEFFTQQKALWLAEFEKKVHVELPNSLIEAEVGRARGSWQSFLGERKLDPETWLKQRGTTREQLEKDWQQAAKSSVTIGLGLAELANNDKKSLQTNEEYQEFLDRLVKKAANKTA